MAFAGGTVGWSMEIIFEFVGGPFDGKTVVGTEGRQDEADRYYALTHHGRIGQCFRVGSEFAIDALAAEQLREERPHHFQLHRYRVTDCIESEVETLVRVEYVEPAEEGAFRRERESAPSVVPPRPLDEVVRQLLSDTARTLRSSYGYCWPVAAREPARGDLGLAVHLGHALLSDDFTVLAEVVHSEATCEPLSLLAVSSGQDWFLACEPATLPDAGWESTLDVLLSRLVRFRLHPGLTIDDCRSHVQRLATHCRQATGLVAVLFAGVRNDPCGPLAFWAERRRGTGGGEKRIPLLEGLDVSWLEPLLLASFDDGRSYYLAGLTFPLPAVA